MKEVKTTVIFVLSLVFFAPAILALGVRYIPDREIPQTGRSIKVFQGNNLEFGTECPVQNLVGIGVAVKNPQRSSSNLIFQLWDEKGNLLRESVINGLSVPDGALVKFIFPPLTLKGCTLQGTFSSDVNEENAMEVYLEKDGNVPAFVSLYKPASRTDLVRNIYRGWMKRLF